MKSDTTFHIGTLRTTGNVSVSVTPSSEHNWNSTCDRTISGSCFNFLGKDSPLSVYVYCAGEGDK